MRGLGQEHSRLGEGKPGHHQAQPLSCPSHFGLEHNCQPLCQYQSPSDVPSEDTRSSRRAQLLKDLVWVQFLAQELPCAVGVAKKKETSSSHLCLSPQQSPGWRSSVSSGSSEWDMGCLSEVLQADDQALNRTIQCWGLPSWKESWYFSQVLKYFTTLSME